MARSPEPDELSNDGSRMLTDDLFEDEEAVCDILKSLISTKGLQSSQKGVSKRLQISEKGLKAAQETIAGLRETYVSLAEFVDMKRTHQGLLEAHGKSIRQMEDLTATLSTTVSREQGRMQNCLSRVETLEQWREKVRPLVDDFEKTSTQMQRDVLQKLEGAFQEVKVGVDKNDEELKSLREQALAGEDSFAREVEAVELRMKEFTAGAVLRITEDLDAVPDASAQGSPQMSKQQQGMMNFVVRATAPLRTDLEKAVKRLSVLTEDLGRHREDSKEMILKMESATGDVRTQLKRTKTSLQEDIETRAPKAKAESDLRSQGQELIALRVQTESLKETVLHKLNLFRDHFTKLGEVVDDHEHCMRHHAEEIENRSTKYDVLLCQHQIDRCARKEEIGREAAEIRKVLSWQSSKIEALVLTTSGLSIGAGAAAAKRGARKTRKITMPGKSGRTSRNTSQVTSSHGSSRGSPGDTVLTMVSEAADEVEDGPMVEGTLSTLQVASLPGADSDGQLFQEGSPDNDDNDVSDEEVDLPPGEDDAESEDERGTSGQVREQLEAVAAGLVGLGNLILREPRLGQGRDARLRQEKEMLDELSNLRHWVTNRMLPAGWDPSKITTVALACAHPRDNELKRPLPQVTMRGMLHDGHSASGRRLPEVASPRSATLLPSGNVGNLGTLAVAAASAAASPKVQPMPPAGARGDAAPRRGLTAKLATSPPTADPFSRMPLSARGHSGVGGGFLPQLPIAVAVA